MLKESKVVGTSAIEEHLLNYMLFLDVAETLCKQLNLHRS